MKGLKDEDGLEHCPHCGAPLLTRHDYREHLTLKSCQTERPNLRRPYPAGWDDRDMLEREK